MAGIRIGPGGKPREGGVEIVNPSEIFSGNGSTTISPWPELPSFEEVWTATEPDEVIEEFVKLLRGPTGDGAGKRKAGTKVSWKVDPGHITAAFRHIGYWADGEQADKDSGCHPLVHAAWRFLAVAYQEQQDYVKNAN